MTDIDHVFVISEENDSSNLYSQSNIDKEDLLVRNSSFGHS